MNLLVPVSWLRDYLKTDLAAKTIASYLTASGPSVDRIEKIGEDYIFDTEVTSNRADSASVFGVAREAHAILASNGEKSQLIPTQGVNTKLDPDISNPVNLDAQVTDPKLCSRFTAIVLQIKIGPSPAIIKNRLKASGTRPINNIVDITNYIMLETGQPMHAFDFDKIEGAKMILRASREGEKLITLDGIKRQLPKGTIVIQDSKKLIDLCGIMGGQNSQITSRTKRVVFFVQSYNPGLIRKTTQSLAFRTVAANLFEKGVDEENIPAVLARAVYLAKKTASAKIISELIDIYSVKIPKKTIRLSTSKLNKYLGTDLQPQKVAKILENLGFDVSFTPNQITAEPPSWRSKDIEADVDLIEEIARIYGYHKLPSTLPRSETPKRKDSDLKDVVALKRALIYLGLTEVITYSIISKEWLKTTGITENNAVELANPLTEEWQFMRPTIVPSLLDVISKGYRVKGIGDSMRIFEIAKTYDKNKKGLPTQDLKIAFALSGSNFLEIKGIIENLFIILARKPKFEKFTEESILSDKSQSAIVKVGDQTIGGLGMISPKAAESFDLDTNVAIAELNLTKIFYRPIELSNYHPIPKFPPITEDISAIFSLYTPIGDIIAEIKKASDFVKALETIDIFEDPKLGENKKSITLTLTYQKSSATPTQEEVNIEREKIVEALESNLRAKVRR